MDELEDGAVCTPDGCIPAAQPAPVKFAGALIVDLSIVSDVVCPWCYIGKRRFEKALGLLGPDFPIRVTWRPFELNPQMPKEGIERHIYRQRKFGSLEYSAQLDAQVASAGAGDGISFRHDLMKRTPNTFDAHRLLWRAHRLGVQDALAETLFRAYFCEGRDVGDRAVLAEMGEKAGMAREETLAFLHGQEGAEDVRRDMTAAQQGGITGVPAFVANGWMLFSGAQQPQAIAGVLRQVAEALRKSA